MQNVDTSQTRTVGWLSATQLISWGSMFYTFALIMEPVERDLGLSRIETSLAFSIALLAEGLMAYPVGRWIERGHERRVMTVGSLVAATCLVAVGDAHSRWGFYGAWAAMGAAMSAVLYSPVFAVVTRRFPADFRRAIITMTFLGGLASTVFIPLTAWLISVLGWRLAIQSLALLACAAWSHDNLHPGKGGGAGRQGLVAVCWICAISAGIGIPPDDDGRVVSAAGAYGQLAAGSWHARVLGHCHSGQHWCVSGVGSPAAVFL